MYLVFLCFLPLLFPSSFFPFPSFSSPFSIPSSFLFPFFRLSLVLFSHLCSPLFLLPPFFPHPPSFSLTHIFSFSPFHILNCFTTQTLNTMKIICWQLLENIICHLLTPSMSSLILVWISMMLIASLPTDGIKIRKWALIGFTNICCMANEERGNASKILKEVLFNQVYSCELQVINFSRPNNR